MDWIVYAESIGARSDNIPAGWAALVISPTHEEQFDQGPLGWRGNTEQLAALVAAVKGLLLVPEGATLELVSGSQYVIDGLNSQEHLPGSKVTEPIHGENAALWNRLLSIIEKRNVRVRGISSDRETERKARALAYAVEASDAAANGKKPASSIVRTLDGKTVDTQTQAEHIDKTSTAIILGNIISDLFDGGIR